MILSKLIQELQRAQERHGDIEVVTTDYHVDLTVNDHGDEEERLVLLFGVERDTETVLTPDPLYDGPAPAHVGGKLPSEKIAKGVLDIMAKRASVLDPIKGKF